MVWVLVDLLSAGVRLGGTGWVRCVVVEVGEVDDDVELTGDDSVELAGELSLCLVGVKVSVPDNGECMSYL